MKKKQSKEEEYRLLILKISEMGKGMKPEIIDWGNIGKNAVNLSKAALAKKCECCGQVIASST